MIDDRIIEKAEATAIERWGRTGSLRAALTAALEAVAADAWDEGAEAQSDYDWLAERFPNVYEPDNPYRASETE